MPIAKRLTIENVNLDDERDMDAFDDQVITPGMERVRAEGDELRRKGLLDGQGNLRVQELPADMKEDADRDFGGWMPARHMFIVAGPPGGGKSSIFSL